MNLNAIVNMVMRMVMQRLIGKGVNAGINAATRGRNKTPTDPAAARRQGANAQSVAKRARQALRFTRRF